MAAANVSGPPSGRKRAGKRPSVQLADTSVPSAANLSASIIDGEGGLPLAKKTKLAEDSFKMKIKKEPEDGKGQVTATATKSKKAKAAQPTVVSTPDAGSLAKPDVPASGNERLTFNWTGEELTQLISNIAACLPKTDSIKYSTLVEKLDWEKIKIGTYTAAECKEKWMQIMTRLRRYRTLTDMVTDAREWLKHPWASYGNSKKPKKHPDLPKKPLTPYFRYFLEKREKYSREHPDMSMTDLAKVLSKKFQQLADKKKQKYKDSYEKEIEIYKLTLEKFKREHPEEFPPPSSREHASTPHEGPDRPMTPFQVFQMDRLKRPEYVQLDRKEATERIRKQWTALSDGKRIKWIRKAVQEEQRYEVDLSAYQEANPLFKADTLKSVLSKAEKELKDRYDGKPDRPPNSGYSLFSKIMLRELKDFPSKEKMGEISRRWKMLSEADRMEYNKQAQKANVKYKEKYTAYLNSLLDSERQKIEIEALAKAAKKKANAGPSAAEKAAGKKIASYMATLVQNGNGDLPIVPMTPTTPSKSKKPFTPMFLYQQEKLPIFNQKHPNLSKTELTRLIAREFSELSEKKKDKYKRLAEDARRRLDEDAASAVKNTSVATPSGKRKLFKGEPRKPPQSGYAIYSAEMLSILTNIDPKSRMAEIAMRWKNMTPVEKDKYKSKAEEQLKKYTKELHKFLSNLSEEDLKEYYKLRAKGTKKKVLPVKGVVPIKEEPQKKQSDSDSSDGEGEDDSSDEEGSEKSDGSGSGSEESGSDSDSDDDNTKKVEGGEKKESSSGESDSDSESGSGSSDDSSESGSDSEEE